MRTWEMGGFIFSTGLCFLEWVWNRLCGGTDCLREHCILDGLPLGPGSKRCGGDGARD